MTQKFYLQTKIKMKQWSWNDSKRPIEHVGCSPSKLFLFTLELYHSDPDLLAARFHLSKVTPFCFLLKNGLFFYWAEIGFSKRHFLKSTYSRWTTLTHGNAEVFLFFNSKVQVNLICLNLSVIFFFVSTFFSKREVFFEVYTVKNM